MDDMKEKILLLKEELIKSNIKVTEKEAIINVFVREKEKTELFNIDNHTDFELSFTRVLYIINLI